MIIGIIIVFSILILTLIILARIWKILGEFHHKNYTYMDFIFISLYFIEQFIFLVLYYSYTQYQELWVGIIVLVTTTTASLDKIMMNSRQRRLSRILNKNILEKNDLLNTLDNLEKENKSLKLDNRIMEKILEKNLQK